MKKLLISILCLSLSLISVIFLMTLKLSADESGHDSILDPNKYLVFRSFNALPNVPEITEDPNDQTFVSSGLCYGCHQAYHLLDPSDPNNNLWRETGAAPIYGDRVNGIENTEQRRNHHPMGTQARLSGSSFLRAPGAEATEYLNKKGELTCISCHADLHGIIPGKDYKQSKENNFLRWDFINDNADFCTKCHSDKTMGNNQIVYDGKHFWNTDSPVTRKVFDPNAPAHNYEKSVSCKHCMFCHFIHDGEERDNEGIPGFIRADLDALMRIGPKNLAWGDRSNDTDLNDYEDMCYGCHGTQTIVGQAGSGSLLYPDAYFTHRFSLDPNFISEGFPVSDGSDQEIPDDYGTQKGLIYCGTCHDVHDNRTSPYLGNQPSPYQEDGLCEACHDKDGQFVSNSHPIGVGPNPDPKQGAPTKAEFVDFYTGHEPLFSQGGSGNPGGITYPYNPNTGESIQGAIGKVICLTCHNIHAAATSWQGRTKTDTNRDHGYLLVKDNMRQRGGRSLGNELCKACHPFGDTEDGFPSGAHGDGGLFYGMGPCKACHTPHFATGPKLWSRRCGTKGCYIIGPFQGYRQLCFSCHCCSGIALTGNETVFKDAKLGEQIPEYYLEDHVMRNWADIEGVRYLDPNHFPLDPYDQDTIPSGPKPGSDTHDGFYCGSCHNPHLKGKNRYLRSRDGNVGLPGDRKDFCDDCHMDAHFNEEEKEGECMDCHHPHKGLTQISENPIIGRLILSKEFQDVTAPYLTGQDPIPRAAQVSPYIAIIFYIEDLGSGVDVNSIELAVQGTNVTTNAIITLEDGDPNSIRVIYDPPYSFEYGESVKVLVKAKDLATFPNALEEHYQFTIIEKILTKPLINEKCWHCHQDMYPDLAPNPDSPGQTDLSCFRNPNDLPYPLYYSTLQFKPNKKFIGLKPSVNFTNSEIYAQRKKGHLSHLVYQPFGLGRWCLDCHDPDRYTQGDPNTPHPSDGYIYFKDKERLNRTRICKDCHGGFYPLESVVPPDNPNIPDPNSVRVLQWGNPGSVTCLQCHDDSNEHGGEYASYISRYSSDDPSIILDPNHVHFYHDWPYNDTNGCLISAPDPDKAPGQNYWSKNGHGVTGQESYAGATLDTGYPDPNRPKRAYPNKGAMNSGNIPDDKHSNTHDLNLDPDDGRKNFCWECHWSNKTVRETICVESLEYPAGFPIGKYNGHLDTIDYRDERWGDPNEVSTHPHHQWKECRECHPTKYSHFVYKKLFYEQRKTIPAPRSSHCIVCHNPHGSGDENGNANVFMIKRRIYKQVCNNCHFSQFRIPPCSPYPPPGQLGSYNLDPNEDTWTVNFLDPLKQDIPEPNSSENSISIPASTTDICEVCHQDKLRKYWPNPGDPSGDEYKHPNGSRHYFNPSHPDSCSDPNTCIIDYRGTDCAGCHIHDPGPVPDPDDPNDYNEITDSRSAFNSKAFAPTCRCHGIGRIDISTLSYETYWGKGDPPDIAGNGHGTPPPPFPVVDPSLPEKDPNQDVHMAHARYNFPCLRCHIDPDDLPYDPNNEYIFELDGKISIGFDQFMNPNGVYEESNKTCYNLYCHSNGKGIYAVPVSWSEAERFCRDPNDPLCIDPGDGHFKYCHNCHNTHPAQGDTIHFDYSTSCDTCHPHNGLYEGKPGFYKHVNNIVEVDKITIEKNLPEGWSMISLWGKPCNKPSLSDLFPDAVVVYGYKRELGYIRVSREESMEVGRGYWILLKQKKNYTLTCKPIKSYTFPIEKNGFYMIGGCTFLAQASLSNGHIEVIYSYVQGFGYEQLLESENLLPGKGYWILISDVIEKAMLTVKPMGL